MKKYIKYLSVNVKENKNINNSLTKFNFHKTKTRTLAAT
jgi:hypothetical protein